MLALEALVLTVTIVASVLLAWWAARRRRRTLLYALLLGLCLQAVAAFAGYRQLTYWDGWDLNPVFSDAELVGTWEFNGQYISLQADGFYYSSSGRHGQWYREDWNVTTGELKWEALKRHGELVLYPAWVANSDLDPDNMNQAVVWTHHR